LILWSPVKLQAGEVVERPASVVKELIENSIDAKAKRISIEILTGGLELIRVSDDGIGNGPGRCPSLPLRDLPRPRFSSVNDLENLQTLGFRGEALPSIASCSKFTMETRAQEAESGVSLYVEGRKRRKSDRQGASCRDNHYGKGSVFQYPRPASNS
jgi:DNA mismatch repair protein MutL